MHHLAALCKQFVLEFPETQGVIYIVNCNIFFLCKSSLRFHQSLLLFFFFLNKQTLKARRTWKGREITLILIQLEAKYKFHTLCWLRLINLLGFQGTAPEFHVPWESVGGQDRSVF